MPRRPPGEGRHVRYNNTKFWALAAVLLPVLPLVEATRHEPPIQHSVIRNSAATALTHDHDLIETPPAAVQRKSPYIRSVKEDEHEHPDLHGQTNIQPYNDIIIHDASAISAAAPGPNVDETEGSVRAPPHLTPARSLEDWEVEDFVLLATIDGDLYANDRRTGKERWHISLGQPMVETKHHRRDKAVVESDSNTIWDQSVWAVEPNGDGDIYMWTPGHSGGLMSTGLSMKALVEKMSPYENKEFSLVYTGEKKTNVLTLDAATGRAIRWFGPNASGADDAFDSCPRPLDPVASVNAEECHSGTITLGRTEYTVGISNPRGYPVATLKYSEWSPNIKDEDLMRQYSATMDKIYVTSRHDGRVYGFDFEREAHNRQSFVEQFPTPIARAFDLMRPVRRYSDSKGGDENLQLTALPQPPLPAKDEQEALLRTGAIFLDQVGGNWYALSARAYPLITKGPVAPINQIDGLWGDEFDMAQLSEALVGQHFVGKPWFRPQIPLLPGASRSGPQLPQLDGPSHDDPDVPTLAIDAPSPSSTVIERVKKLPQDAANSVIEAFTNPFVASLLMIALFAYRHEIIRRAKRARKQSVGWAKGVLKHRGFQVDLDEDSSDESSELQIGEDDQVPEKAETEPEKEDADVLVLGDKPASDPNAPATDTEAALSGEAKVQTVVADGALNPPEKKKKAHRGRRGGKMHKKKKAESGSADDEQLNEVEEAVNYAKKLGEPARGPEPDIMTVPDDVGNVSIPILRIDDSLEVIQEQQLGTGSNGTVVFAGKWQDRPVAVKRMLRSFYDIASRETRLLREVDRHDNVIQYYAQLERGDFIYIALELCEASLADVVEKPSHFRALAEAGSKDPLRVLRQITRGIDHLHSLQIGKWFLFFFSLAPCKICN